MRLNDGISIAGFGILAWCVSDFYYGNYAQFALKLLTGSACMVGHTQLANRVFQHVPILNVDTGTAYPMVM